MSLEAAPAETWSTESVAPRSTFRLAVPCGPVYMTASAIFSSRVAQVTGVPLGQMPCSPEEIFYYLP